MCRTNSCLNRLSFPLKSVRETQNYQSVPAIYRSYRHENRALNKPKPICKNQPSGVGGTLSPPVTPSEAYSWSCHDRLSFYMWKGPFCWVQRYILYPNPFSFSPSNQSKTKNPGTSKALETGYQERYWHPKMATRKGFSIQNWLPGKVLAPKTGYPEKYGHPKLATRKRDYR